MLAANSQAAQAAQSLAGNTATIAAWDPALGGTKPAPWPFHSWPQTQEASGYKTNMAALQARLCRS